MQLESIWQELASDTSATAGIVRRRIGQQAMCGIWLAVQKPQDIRVLQIEVGAQSIPAGFSMPRSRGFEVQVVPFTPGPNGRVQLTLFHTLNGYPEIFSALCEDVVQGLSAASTEKAAVSTFIARLSAWQRFLERHALDGLPAASQLGLYGELKFLARTLSKHVPLDQAIDAWTGPLGANQDFQLGSTAVEVKTTRANSQERFHVSNARQLDTTGTECLLLYQLALDVRQDDSDTLPLIINQIREMIAGLPTSLETFNQRLLEVGYLDAHMPLYARTSYTEREHNVFLVNDGFPRIIEADLRDGVGSVKYTVAIAACMPFSITDLQFVSHMVGSELMPADT